MSYCVNCGVKLADYETDCPLCKTTVVNPGKSEESKGIYPQDRLDINGKQINKRFLAMLISLTLLISSAVVVIIDLIISSGLIWAFYVFGAELMLWTFIVLPICVSGKSPFIYLSANLIVTCLYIFMVNLLTGSTSLFISLEVPVIVAVWICAFFATFIFRNKRIGKIEKSGLVTVISSILPWGIDIAVTHYLSGSFMPVWAWYVSVPMLILGGILIIASKNIIMSEWIRRNLFF